MIRLSSKVPRIYQWTMILVSYLGLVYHLVFAGSLVARLVQCTQDMNTINVKRNAAAAVLETIAIQLYKARQERKLTDQERALAQVLRDAGISLDAFSTCHGEAHDPKVGGMIDHCGCCAPRWGIVGPTITVK